MPDEPVVPPQRLPNPEKLGADGTLTRKQKRYMAGGVIVALSVLVVASIAHKPEAATPKPKPKPVQTLAATMPSAPVVNTAAGTGATTTDPVPAMKPVPPNAYPGTSYASPDEQRPEKTLKEQMRDERAQLEEKSEFDDNVVNSTRAFSGTANAEPGPGATPLSGTVTPPALAPVSSVVKTTTLDFDPKQATFTLPEGTVIDCALVNEINGEFSGPVVAQVSTAVYAPETRIVLIPQGTRVIGEATKVGSYG